MRCSGVAIAAARSLSRPPPFAQRAITHSLAQPLSGYSQLFSQPSRWMSSSAAIRFSRNHLSLYRQLLRAHAQRLPAAQRELGDAYVKSEFRSHRDADAKFLAAFESQWREYLGVLRSQSVDAPGRDLTADELSAMSDEQKVQVVDIYEKSRKAGDDKPDS